MDDQTLLVIAFNATITLLVLAVIYRPLVIECVDPVFLRTVSRAGAPAHLAFLALVVVNLVNGFHALGTLLAVGLMILPAGIARFWSRDITGMICIAVVSAMVSGYAGLVLSFQTRIPSGPAIILVAAGIYVVSVLFGSVSGLVRQLFPAPPSRGMTMRAAPAHSLRCSRLAASLAGARAGAAECRRQLFDPRRFRKERRRRPRQCHDPGRPQQRRACLFADAGGREEDRRRKARDRQRPRLRRLAAAAGEILRQQGDDRDRDDGIAPLQAAARDADPHAWQSVANAKVYVANIRDALSAADPAGCRDLQGATPRPIWQSSTRSIARSARPWRKFRPARRKVISTHDAFGYFAAAYGIEFIAPLGVSTESEPSARDIAGIITQIKAGENSGGISGKCQRSPADPADLGRDRRQGRRDPVFRQSDRRKGRCPHLH